MIILGAGLAGCIAGHLFPGSLILEAGKADEVGQHKALLRFRTDAISRITGIPFRKVKVYKAVVSNGVHYLSDVPMKLLNNYSKKVTGRVTERSIFNLTAVDRWIAPEDFHAQMVKRLDIEFDWPVSTISKVGIWSKTETKDRGWDLSEEGAVISTIPLPEMLKATALSDEFPVKFERQPIYVQRAKIQDCDVYQTIYFPGAETDVYRASITGGTFIIESMNREPNENDWSLVCYAFGIDPHSLTIGKTTQQRFGKILPLPEDERHAILMRITQQANVYSFGRFACWRNLLLDDLPADAERIRAMLRMTEYQRKVENAR